MVTTPKKPIYTKEQLAQFLHSGSDEDLARLKGITDNELLRCAQTLDMFSGVESTRRLREVMHKEEVAIKGLTQSLVKFTKWLFGFTIVLVGLTIVLVYQGYHLEHTLLKAMSESATKVAPATSR